jgi:hypothetical protein
LELQLAPEDERTVFLDAIEESLRPLMRAVFEYGVSYQDLVGVVRALYIFALRERYESQGRPATEARLSVMTGVTRGEVVKLFSSRAERDEQRALAAKQTDQLSQLLARWHDDPEFSTPYGAPLELSLKPEGNFRTLDQLIQMSGVDLDRETIISYLSSAGCIEVHGTRFVRCVNRNLISRKADVVRISHLGRSLAAQTSTLVRNLFRQGSEVPFFERTMLSDFPISGEARDRLLAHLSEDGAEFINDLDRWISDKRELLSDPKGSRYGVSMFFFREPEVWDARAAKDDMPGKVA